MAISQRLLTLYDHAIKEEPFWDVACDHGLLGLRALKSGEFPEVHFVDPVPEIIERLRAKLAGRGFAAETARAHLHAVEFSKVKLEIRGSIIMAGVGANTILEELALLSAQTNFQPQRLILSPHKNAEIFLQRFAKETGAIADCYFLVKELVLTENERERRIFVFEKSSS